MTHVLDDLQWRGLIALSTDLEALRAELSRGPITYYCGFDPTAPSLHVGNLVQILTVRRLQLAGHRPLALVGGATGLIGDPRETAERQLHGRDVVAEWVERVRAQIEPYLDFTGEFAATMVNNLDWTAPLSAIDFLRDVGKHFRVNRMIAKDVVSTRLRSEEGISYTEFSYQILQGMDYLELFRRYGCRLQTGGSDQWGNLTSGSELIRKVTGESVHLIATPLITDSQGRKLGKSTGGGGMWLDPQTTSPYAFYQFFVNAEDEQVPNLLRTFTFLTRAQIDEVVAAHDAEPFRRIGQKRIALEVTSLVHGTDAAAAAIAASDALFGQGDLAVLDAETLASALRELPHSDLPSGTSVVRALVDTGLVASLGEARRAIAQGGVSVDGVKVDDEAAVVGGSLPGGVSVLRRGKKTLAGVFVIRP